MRELEAVEKRPATRELINWIRALNADPDFKPKRLAKGDVPFLGYCSRKAAITSGPAPLSTAGRCSDYVRLAFFYKLKEMGVPVSPTAFLTLHRALANRPHCFPGRVLHRFTDHSGEKRALLRSFRPGICPPFRGQPNCQT
jgi:hypothetical protein